MSTPFAAAQNGGNATGRVTDSKTSEALEKATLQLFALSGRDTTFVAGTFTDENGLFTLSVPVPKQYLLKVTCLGYKPITHTFAKSQGHDVALGTLKMTPDAIMLDEATVTANVPKMVVKDDTLVYNADAYRVPEGSVIENLVEMLPGAKVEENGSVTINGKTVKKFKMDGRDFMTGNNSAVMKNLPSYVVDQVKAYDDKSDLSRMTGIDDGEDDFVLEFVTKRSVRKGLQMNPDIGIGTEHRYGIRLTAMKPFGDMRYTFMGNANNVNDRNFSGRGGRGRGNNDGQRHNKTAALDISYENGRDLKMSGRVTWNHNNADNWNRTGSENFVNTRGGAFTNSVSQSYSRSNSWTGNINLQWRIDTLTNLSFRPNLSFSTNDGRQYNTSASFNENPFGYIDNPLDPTQQAYMDEQGLIVNGQQRKSMSYSTQNNASAQMQLFRRLSRNGRNIALNTNINYRKSDSKNASLSAVHLYQMTDMLGNDSTYQTNRYTVSPNHNFSYSAGLAYTEPLYIFKTKPADATPQNQGEMREGGMPGGERGGNRGEGFGGGGRGGEGRGGGGGRGGGRNRGGLQGVFLQLNYRYQYSHQKNDPSTYDFPLLPTEGFDGALQKYREWAQLFGLLDNPYEDYLSDNLSRYSERTEYGHNAEVQIRVVREKYTLNAGVQAQPQKSHYIQQYLGIPIDTIRTVTNVSPTLNFRYRPNRQTNLQVQYRGNSTQPSITQLLDIYDDSNPMSITMGNPGLKPSFTSNLNINFQKQRQPRYETDEMGQNVAIQQRHWSYNANGSLSLTRNAIGNVMTYNESTGGRITRPENINGNWSANAGASFNIALDTLNRWDVSGGIRGSYNHRVGYVNLNRTAVPDRNVTHTYNLSPQASLSYRNKWLNVSVNGSATYAHTENRLQATNNLTTWNFSYGANTKITFTWGMALSADMHMMSKRGYTDSSLNTNELICNAQLSQPFLKGKKLTVMLQWYDIFRQQTNFTRTVSANGWTDREVNAITTYAMLHVSYRLNLFGNGGNGRQGEGRRGPGGWQRRDDRMPF